MPDGVSMGAEVASSAPEGARAGIAPVIESSVDTAGENLASSVGAMQEAEGTSAAFADLAEGATDENVDIVNGARGDEVVSGESKAQRELPETEAVKQSGERVDGTQVIEEGAQPKTAQEDEEVGAKEADAPADATEGEATQDGDKTPDDTADAEPLASAQEQTVEAEAQAAELTSKVESMSNEMADLGERMAKLEEERVALETAIASAIAKIPDLELTLKDLMEKATPEQKKKVGLLMTLLQMLIKTVGGFMGGVAGSNNAEGKKETSVSTAGKPITTQIGVAAARQQSAIRPGVPPPVTA